MLTSIALAVPDPGSEPGPDDDSEIPPSFNMGAFIVLALASIVAFVALFSLPLLRSFGLSFQAAFWVVSAVEFVTAVVAGVAALKLYSARDPEVDSD